MHRATNMQNTHKTDKDNNLALTWSFKIFQNCITCQLDS